MLPHPVERRTVLSRLSALRIRDYLLPDISPSLAQLSLIPEILHRADPGLAAHLSRVRPWYALAGTLSLYAHTLETQARVSRVFDAVLARPPVFVLYVFVEVVLRRRDELFEVESEDADVLHSILCKLPAGLDVDAVLRDADALMSRFPPSGTRAWRRGVSRNSVLKTSPTIEAAARQSVEQDGRRFFEAQVAELRWAKKRDRALEALASYGRPAQVVALTVLVGFAAIYLERRPGGAVGALSYAGSLIWRFLGGR